MVSELDEDLAPGDLERTSGVVVLDFYKDGCAPCALLAPTIDALAKEFPDVEFLKVNVDKYPVLAARHRVAAFPTVYVYSNGAIVNHFVGRKPYAVIAKIITEAR